uniref:Uncharacterized protein n=2 Tax=Palpitomonas bilix TaxID=652834 RepID=A0A7S3D9M9_9EUKA|mmetsp:Transcript_28117/g.71684  ORF Transcript_28117/g.71684 Transcript_28117/m.71684 type:complete len:251 (+) Transcript_28117:316-1068(+)
MKYNKAKKVASAATKLNKLSESVAAQKITKPHRTLAKSEGKPKISKAASQEVFAAFVRFVVSVVGRLREMGVLPPSVSQDGQGGASVTVGDLPPHNLIILANVAARDELSERVGQSEAGDHLLGLWLGRVCAFTVLRRDVEEMGAVLSQGVRLPFFGYNTKFMQAVTRCVTEDRALYRAANLLKILGKDVIVIGNDIPHEYLAKYQAPVVTVEAAIPIIQSLRLPERSREGYSAAISSFVRDLKRSAVNR